MARMTLRSVLRYMSARRSSLAMAGCRIFNCAASDHCTPRVPAWAQNFHDKRSPLR